jgi:hypothetical protein
VALLAGMQAYSQLPTVTTTPGEIDALTENVTIEFDVTGTTVEGVADIYIWAWSPQLAAPTEILLDYEQGSASWGSISENAKLATVEGQPNKRRIQLPLTVTRAGVEVTFKNVAELFGVAETPGKIKEFGFLLRNQDGTKQTPGDLQTKVTLVPLEFSEAFFRIFPARVSKMDVVSVYMNLNQLTEAAENVKLLVATSFKTEIILKDSEGLTLVEVSDIEMVPQRPGEYSITFSPTFLGQFAEGKSIDDVAGFDVKFSGALTTGTSNVVVESKVYEVEFQDYE